MLNIVAESAEDTLFFPSISIQPSIQPDIDDSFYRVKKGKIWKTRGEESRDNIFLIASITIITVSATERVFRHPGQNEDWKQWRPTVSHSGLQLEIATAMTGNGLCILN